MGCMLRTAGVTQCLRPNARMRSMAEQETRQGRTSDGKRQRKPALEQVDSVRRVGRAGVRDDQRAEGAGRAMLAPATSQPLSDFQEICFCAPSTASWRRDSARTFSALTQHALCMVWIYVASSRQTIVGCMQVQPCMAMF